MEIPQIPPPGGDQNHGPLLLAAGVASGALAFMSTILRMFGRTFIVRSVGWDDHIIIAATAISLFAVVADGEQVKYGAGRHEYSLKRPDIIQELKWHAFSQIQLYICTALIKTSVCLFLIRIVNKRYLVRILYVLSAVIIMVNLAVVLVLVTQCRPLEKVWNVRVMGQCWRVEVLKTAGWIAGAFAVVTDFICSLLPCIFLRRVQINPRTKHALCAVMGLGLVATAFSILKMSLSHHLGAKDATYSQSLIQISAILEENIGIIAVNMPLMRPLFGIIQPKIKNCYNKMRKSVEEKLYKGSNSTSDELKSVQRDWVNRSIQNWGLRVPGSSTMKSIDLSLSRIVMSGYSEDNETSLSDDKHEDV